MTALENVPLTVLEKELARRQERFGKKQAERDALLAKLAEIDAEISQLSGVKAPAPKSAEEKAAASAAPAAPQSPKTPKKRKAAKKASKKTPGKRGRKPILPGAIQSVLSDSGRPMTSQEIADELQRRNFPTKSKDLKSLVQEAVSRVPGIKRVKRGLFKAAK